MPYLCQIYDLCTEGDIIRYTSLEILIILPLFLAGRIWCGSSSLHRCSFGVLPWSVVLLPVNSNVVSHASTLQRCPHLSCTLTHQCSVCDRLHHQYPWWCSQTIKFWFSVLFFFFPTPLLAKGKLLVKENDSKLFELCDPICQTQ